MQSWSLLTAGSLRIAAKAVVQLRVSSQVLPAASQPFSLMGKEERRWVSYGGERGDSDWWTDNNGHDFRKREQEKYDSMKHPEKAKAHAIFMSKPGLIVSVEDFGLEHASRKLGRKVVVEGIVEKFRAQRRHEYPCQIRRQEKKALIYRRAKKEINKILWGATQARERGF